MTAPGADETAMLEQLAANPFAMLASAGSFHSVFLAPHTPQFLRARDRFVEHGDGPLAGVVEDLQRQGLDPARAQAQAKSILQAAQGMCVAVVTVDGSVQPVAQPWFGDLSPAWRQHAVQALGAQFPDGAALASGLDALAGRQPVWPRCAAGPQASGDLREYWMDLAAGLVAALDGAFGRHLADRLADLAWWCADALRLLGADDADALELRTRCLIACGEHAQVRPLLETLLASPDAGHDTVATLLESLADAGCAAGGSADIAGWLLGDGMPRCAAIDAGYEAALCAFRLLAAAGDPGVERAAEALWGIDRKSARHELTREPRWRVTASVAADACIDTAEAAQRIGRSTQFIAKRLDAGTIPVVRDGQRVRFPVAALDAWKRIMDQRKLLD